MTYKYSPEFAYILMSFVSRETNKML